MSSRCRLLQVWLFVIVIITTHTNDTGSSDRIRLLIERLATLGLLKAPPTTAHSRQPSFLSSLLPPLLAHLHPPSSSPLPPYSPTYLPSIFLPLPASTLSAFVSSLLQHLSARIDDISLDKMKADERIHRAIDVFGLIIGRAEVGGEAWDAVMRAISTQKNLSDSTDVREHVIARIVCGWVRSGGSTGASKIE
jgi:telomere length regulation protein